MSKHFTSGEGCLAPTAAGVTPVRTAAGPDAAAQRPADRGGKALLESSTGRADGSAAGAPLLPSGAAAAEMPPSSAGVRYHHLAKFVAAANLIRQGSSVSGAATAVGCSGSAVHDNAKRLGLTADDLRTGPEWVLRPYQPDPDRQTLKPWRLAAAFEEQLRAGLNIKESCAALGIERSTYHHNSRWVDAGLKAAAYARVNERRRAQHRLTPEVVAAVEAAILAGMTRHQVAEVAKVREQGLNEKLRSIGRTDLIAALGAGRDAKWRDVLLARAAALEPLLREGLGLKAAARKMGLHIDAIHKVRPMIPANLWPVASRTRLTLRQKIEQLVQKDGVRSDLARIVKCPVRELEGFMATNGMTDLWQRCEANLQKRLDAAQLARSQGWADKIISYLEQGYSLTDVAGFIPHLRGSYWDAAVALVPDQMLRTVSRRVKAVQVAQPRAPQRPVLLPSYLDVEGADRAALAETKGRHAALSAWAKARGLSPAQAQARWHRLPAALKEA